jgi:hypothetical protein
MAAALGFESVEELAQWLGSLSEQDRSTVLFGLIGGAS